MILHAQAKEGQARFPWLVFLHGLSDGCWGRQTVDEALQDYSRLYVDLPRHGGSIDIDMSGFDDVSVLLHSTLLSYNILNCWLVRYSLGSRTAMMATYQEMLGLCDLVVEGGHPGLQSEEACVQRRLSDGRWAARFRAESLCKIFNDWYRQPVFSSLNAARKEALVVLRSQNSGQILAAMLEATSPAVQPDLRAQLTMRTFPFYYLCGKRNDKFRVLVVEISISNHVIHSAGYSAHRDDPTGVVDCLVQILRR